MLLVTFNKRVMIRNPRINAVYWTLLFITLASFFVKFILFRDYVRNVDMSGDVKAIMWVNKVNRMEADSIWEQKSREPLCRSPHDYDYWWDAAGEWTYTNHSCLPLCPTGKSSHGCISLFELYVLEGQSQAFLASQMQETFLPETGQDGKTAYYFLPIVEAMGVSLRYSYDMHKVNDPVLLDRDDSRSASSFENLRTIVVDAAGHTYKTIDPSDVISLSVPELLTLAGDANLLDKMQPAAGPNQMPNASYDKGPIARITGLELVVNIECENPMFVFDFRDREDQVPTCKLSVRAGRQFWSSVEQLDIIGTNDGGTRHRQYHGLRIRCRTQGSMEFVDYNIIFFNVISAMVLLSIPKTITRIFMIHCLGHLSKIYHRVITEVFSVPVEISGIATRLMAAGVSFVGLTDVASMGISKARLRERLLATLRYQKGILDQEKIQHFVNFIFQCLTDKKSFLTTRSIDRSFIHEMFLGGQSRKFHDPNEEVVDVDGYSAACCSGERIGFDDVVRLFDSDRQMGVLERCFLPGNMRDFILRERNVGKSENASFDDDNASHVKLHVERVPSRSSRASSTSRRSKPSSALKRSVYKTPKAARTLLSSMPNDHMDGSPKSALKAARTLLSSMPNDHMDGSPTSALKAARTLLSSMPNDHMDASPKSALKGESSPSKKSSVAFMVDRSLGGLVHDPGGSNDEGVSERVSDADSRGSELSFDPNSNMTLEQEKQMLHWMQRVVRNLKQRDIEKTVEIEETLLRVKSLENDLVSSVEALRENFQKRVAQQIDTVAHQIDEMKDSTISTHSHFRVELDNLRESMASQSHLNERISSIEAAAKTRNAEIVFKLDVIGARVESDRLRTKSIEKELKTQLSVRSRGGDSHFLKP